MKVTNTRKQNDGQFNIQLRQKLEETTISVEMNGLELAIIGKLMEFVSGRPETSVRREADTIQYPARKALSDLGISPVHSFLKDLLALDYSSLDIHALDLPERI